MCIVHHIAHYLIGATDPTPKKPKSGLAPLKGVAHGDDMFTDMFKEKFQVSIPINNQFQFPLISWFYQFALNVLYHFELRDHQTYMYSIVQYL